MEYINNLSWIILPVIIGPLALTLLYKSFVKDDYKSVYSELPPVPSGYIWHQDLSIGDKCVFKMDHWKHYQDAEVLYISESYVIINKSFGGRDSEEYCIGLKNEHEFTFKHR